MPHFTGENIAGLLRHGVGLSPLRGLAVARSSEVRRKRVSSYDKTGGNDDYMWIEADGEWVTIAEIDGPGIINHTWMTFWHREPYSGRKILIRFLWDDDEVPGVVAPIGDFFGLGHGLSTNYSCAVMSASPQGGKGLNMWFPMPFRKKVKIQILNELDLGRFGLYFYFDYEEYSNPLPDELLYFHAHWRRDNPCVGLTREQMAKMTNKEIQLEGKNITGDKNYVILDCRGCGHYVGCNLHVTNLRETLEWNWWGEGDDMIFVDGEKWPPSIHGTGSEDYFNTAYCPQEEVREPYHGVVLGGDKNWAGRISMYRYHVEDPVVFTKDIRVTIEHGHDNRRSDDYSSTAYWYSDKASHPELPEIPGVKDRLPVKLGSDPG